MLSPCLIEWDRANGSYRWHVEFGDPDLQGMYDALADVPRWQFTNLMLQERFPMLWFYFRRTRLLVHGRRSQRERLTLELPNTVFRACEYRAWLLFAAKRAASMQNSRNCPISYHGAREDEAADIYQALDGTDIR